MVEPQVSRFWRAAEQSGLIGTDALRACWESLPEEKRTPEAIDRRLARQAVNAGHLTIWQAQQLMAGRATGFQIDRYLLLGLIGQGGMGRVYLARDTRLSRRVALKVLSKERVSNPRAIARFQREARVGAQLQHENLVRIYDEGEAGGVRFLVMEYIDGKNVAQLIAERGAIPWRDAARLARQVALGLEHAQAKGLIHRDVNPSNILVTHDGTAKLTDLGLAIDLADEANVTRDGATVGTFDYISPEQAKHSREVDTRADIYSLGCTLYHMISGRVPFPMPSLAEKLYAHQLHDPESLSGLVPGVPEGIAAVVRRMMRKAPADRYATPRLVAEALAPFVDDSARSGPSPFATSPAVDGDRPAGDGPKARVAAPFQLDATIPPGPAAAEADARAPAAPATAPGADRPAVASGSDPDLALFALDIGPAAPLRDPLSGGPRGRPRPRPKGDSASRSGVAGGAEGESPARDGRFDLDRLDRLDRLKPAAIGLAIVLAAAVGIVAVVAWSRNKLRDRSDPPVVPAEGSPPAASKAIRRGDPTDLPPLSVVTADGAKPAASLAEAVAIAVGNGGDVVIGPEVMLRLDTAQEVRVPRGNLTIRAAEGTSPVVAVDAGGPGSMLVTTTGGSLTLKGLRVLAHYRARDGSAPLIRAGGPLRVERCTFVATGATGGSKALAVDGPRLSVEGCLFEGFDRPLVVDSFPGSEVAIAQTMLVHAADGDRSPGWALRLRYAGGPGDRPRRVAIDRATVRGGGLLELEAFPEGGALEVTLDHAAIRTRALLAWGPAEGEAPGGWAKGMTWRGRANRYDVTGAPWVVLSGTGELPTPGAPVDLASWSKAVGSDEDSTGKSFRLAADPTGAGTDPPAPGPGQYALVGEEPEGVGADPKRVGPAASR